MTVLSAIGSVALLLMLLYLPGAAAAAMLVRRPLSVLAAAPAAGYAMYSVGAMVTTAAGIRWTPAAVAGWLVICLVVVALGAVAAGVLDQRAPWARRTEGDDDVVAVSPVASGATSSRGAWWAAGAVVLGAVVVGAGQVIWSSDLLRQPAQYWDAIFHGVAIRFIAEEGAASPFALAGAAQPANDSFYYPDVYHAVGALLLQLPGQSMPGVLSALSAATVVIFVLGTVAVVRHLDGGPVAVAASAAMAATTWSFPFARINWGPVLPYALGVASITGAVALGVLIVRFRRFDLRRALLLGAVMAGLLAVHPSVGAGAAIVLAALLAVGSADGSRAWSLVTFVVAALAAMAVFLPQFSLVSGSDVAGFRWPKLSPVSTVIGEYLNVALFPPLSVLWWLLLIVGVAVAVQRRSRPPLALALAGLAFSVQFFLAYTVAADWSHLFTAVWWDDGSRLHALVIVASTPVVGLGAGALAAGAARIRPAAARGGVQAAMLLMLAAALVGGHLTVRGELTRWVYGNGPAVNEYEAEMFAELADRYDGGMVLGDPFDGSSWIYTLYGIPVVLPAPLVEDPDSQVGPARMLLYTSIARYGFDPGVTLTVENMDVRWVIVGSGVIGGPGRPPGFVGMGWNPHLELVAANEGARLYRVRPVSPHPLLPVPPGVPPVVPPVEQDVDSLSVVGGPDQPAEP
ncbi:DUF6541 family protein [Dietzia sp. NPDC055343]